MVCLWRQRHLYRVRCPLIILIPFAMLVGVVGLFESQTRFNMFKDNTFEVMYFNKRVSYFKDYAEQTPNLNPPFSSAYVCSKMLPQQIVFTELDKPSRPRKATGAGARKAGV